MFALVVKSGACVQVEHGWQKAVQCMCGGKSRWERPVAPWKRNYLNYGIFCPSTCNWPETLPVQLSLEKKNSITIQVELNCPGNSKAENVTDRRLKERRRETETDKEWKKKEKNRKEWWWWGGGIFLPSKTKTKKQTNKEIKYTWKVSCLLPEKMSHLCMQVPSEQDIATSSPWGVESRDAACLWQCCA